MPRWISGITFTLIHSYMSCLTLKMPIPQWIFNIQIIYSAIFPRGIYSVPLSNHRWTILFFIQQRQRRLLSTHRFLKRFYVSKQAWHCHSLLRVAQAVTNLMPPGYDTGWPLVWKTWNLEMSGNLLTIREVSGNKPCHGKRYQKLVVASCILVFIQVFSSISYKNCT